MGPQKTSSLSLGLIGFFALWAMTPGCKSDKRGSVSSEAFLAPQLVAVNPATGLNAEGKPALEVLVDKLDILTEVHRKPDGSTELPGVLLQKPTPSLVVLGKLDQNRLLIFEAENKVLLTADLSRSTNQVRMVLNREAFLSLFRNIQKPVIGPPRGPPSIKLQNGWLLGYEVTSRALFAVREDPNGGPEVVAVLVLDQKAIQNQLLTKSPVEIRQMVEFGRDQILVIPGGTIPAIHHLEVEDRGMTLGAKFVLPDGEPLVTFDKIKTKTGNVQIDVKDFSPISISGTGRVILFDRSMETSSFLSVNLRTGFDGVVRASVEVLVDRLELSALVQQTSAIGDPFAGQFKFENAFLHPDADREVSDPERTTLFLAFEAETNNLIAIDWTRRRGDAGGVSLFSSTSQISNRTDLKRDLDLDSGTFDPTLMFARDDIVSNKLCFDTGPDELVALNYETGQFVVVLHKRDIGGVTKVGPVELTYIESLGLAPPGKSTEIRIVDMESASIIAARLEYLPVPLHLPRL